MALTTGIDPWSLLHLPDHVVEAVEVVWLEFKKAEQRAERQGDLRARLRAATGR